MAPSTTWPRATRAAAMVPASVIHSIIRPPWICPGAPACSGNTHWIFSTVVSAIVGISSQKESAPNGLSGGSAICSTALRAGAIGGLDAARKDSLPSGRPIPPARERAMSERAACSPLRRRDVLKLGARAVAAAGTAVSAEAQTPKRGGVFRIRGEDATSGFDPHLAVNHHRIASNLSFTHSRLVRWKAGAGVKPGTAILEPDLAESWTQPNDSTFIFKLRRGVRWHNKPPVNGRELTADDVKYTYERFLSIK